MLFDRRSGAIAKRLIVAFVPAVTSCGQVTEVVNMTHYEKPEEARAIVSADAGEAELCRALTSASEAGTTSLNAPLVTDSRGADYVGADDRAVSRSHGWFAGAELQSGRCWASGRLELDSPTGRRVLQWRCPTSLVSANPRKAGEVVLEEVNSAECDFNSPKGRELIRKTTGKTELVPSML
jgi:hypothetical protein